MKFARLLIDAGFLVSDEQLIEIGVDEQDRDFLLSHEIKRHEQFSNAMEEGNATVLNFLHRAAPIDDEDPLGLGYGYQPAWLVGTRELDKVNEEHPTAFTWRLRFASTDGGVHPMKLDFWPRISDDMDERHYVGWHGAILSAVRSTPNDDRASVIRLKEVLGRTELGLGLENIAGNPVEQITPQHDVLLQSQFYAIAISRNNVLHDVVRELPPLEPSEDVGKHARRVARNERASWMQANALLQANEAFRPYRIRLIDPVEVGAIENAVAEKRMSVSEAIREVDGAIARLQSQSARFSEILQGEQMPDSLHSWLGAEVVALHAQRREELHAARTRLRALRFMYRVTSGQA